MKPLKMTDNKTPGMLITFCGLDGCGKTTLMTRLSEEIGSKYKLFITKQPTESMRKSDIFRTYMDSPDHGMYDYRTLSLMAAADRIQHVNKVIKQELDEGYVVISDRYFYSCLANLRARGFKKDKWIYEISEFIIKPDIAFFLDLPTELAIERVRKRVEEKNRFIDIDLQYKLRNEYIDICKKNKGVYVPTDKSEDESYEIIKNKVKEVILKKWK